MALPSGTYAPRDPAALVLYQVVRDHYHTFRAEASELAMARPCRASSTPSSTRSYGVDGSPVDSRVSAARAAGPVATPAGILTGERLVAFSCKCRGFCPLVADVT